MSRVLIIGAGGVASVGFAKCCQNHKVFTHILKTAYVIAFIKDCKTDSMNILNKVSIEMINKDSSLLDLYKKVKR